METIADSVTNLTAGTLKLKIYPNRQQAGIAAAQAVAQEIRRLGQSAGDIGVVFATGAAQFDTLESLVSLPDLPWERVVGFHLDEYVGLQPDHPAGFRHFLRKRLTSHVAMRHFYEIDGTAADLDVFMRDYVEALRRANPQLCLMGIGENGHIAFNDPPEADFNDPKAMKVVLLDEPCRRQQAAEGWFPTLQDVPERALTLTIPTVMQIPKLIASVPGSRKSEVIRRTVQDPISTACPSTLLRTHPDATLYLDIESASELQGLTSN